MRNVVNLKAILLFIAFYGMLASCKKYDPTQIETATNQTNPNYVTTLAGQTWVLTQYREEPTSNILARNDTIVFITDKKCTWNGIDGNYSIGFWDGANSYWFSFDTTPFGGMRGAPAQTFTTFGELNGEPFLNNSGPTDHTYDLWMHRI